MWVCMMFLEGLKLLYLLTVNSPSLMVHQKVVVRQANIAASKGVDMSRDAFMDVIVAVRSGGRLDRLDDSGAKVWVARRTESMVGLSVSKCSPWIMCQALMAMR